MEHFCFRCGNWRSLNTFKMCAPCMTMWYSATPTARRALLRVVDS